MIHSTTDANLDSFSDRPVNKTMALSPTTAYYIRRLLRQNIDRLQTVVAKGAGVAVDPLTDLNAVISSLYLEEEDAISAVLSLERLAALHQGLNSQGNSNRKGLVEIEKEIFWILGFKPILVKHQGTILVVDDTPENLQLLTTTLRQQGYEVSCAISGEVALNSVQHISPDLILLDVRMPVMDGYQVCQVLKASVQTQDIPVLFLSASDDVSDKVKAFEVGGADYITKPFQIGEVLARVQHQLKLRELQKRLEQQNVTLQKEVRDRQLLEQRLGYQKSYMQAILHTLPHLVWLKDVKNRHIAVNDAYCQLSGIEAQQLLGRLPSELPLTGWLMELKKADAVAIDSRQPQQFEQSILDSNGVQHRFSAHVVPVFDAEQTVIGAVGIAIDITAEKGLDA